MGGMIAKVLSFVGRSVKIDPGGGAIITGKHFAPPGDDSQPLAGDYCTAISTPQSGRAAVVGYTQSAPESKAGPGEKRIYSRDASGAVIAEIHLKNDGTIDIIGPEGSVTWEAGGRVVGKNSAGQFSLESSGDFLANGARMSVDGDIQTADGKSLRAVSAALDSFRAEYDAHTHTAPSGGGPTSTPI